MAAGKRRKLVTIIIILSLGVVLALGFLIYSAKAKAAAETEEQIAISAEDCSRMAEALTGGANAVAKTSEEGKLSEERIRELREGIITFLMVDDSEENERVVDRFADLGYSVTMVYDFDPSYVREYDALIIPGGGNVTPSMYNEERSQYTSGTDLEKDELQITAVKAFAEAKKPIFGICRGCQLINVAFGGTLDQGNGEYHQGWHTVDISSDSLFYPYFGDSVDAYHYHKQQVGRLADGFVATQYAADREGLIEAIEHESLPIYGLQWHCDAVKMGEDGEKACQAFIDVVKKYRGLDS